MSIYHYRHPKHVQDLNTRLTRRQDTANPGRRLFSPHQYHEYSKTQRMLAICAKTYELHPPAKMPHGVLTPRYTARRVYSQYKR